MTSPAATSPATKRLLARLEPLRHVERMQLMVKYGVSANPDVLRDLEAGGVYARQMALMTCYSSRDAGRVERGLQDASRVVRGVALKLAPLVLSDAQVLAALRLLPSGSRLALLHGLRGRKRAEPIADALLEELSAAGDLRAVTALLGFASGAWVARHLPAMELASKSEWARVARSQPLLIADWLEGQVSSDSNPRLVWQVDAVVLRIAERSEARAAQLLGALRATVPLGQLALQPLMKRHPRLVAQLLLTSKDQTALELSGVAHRLAIEQVIALQAQHPGSLRDLEQYLTRFAPADRVSLFATARAAWADSDGLFNAQTLGCLPRELRESEARRHLAHPSLSVGTLRLPYAGLLGFQQAAALLEPSVKHPNAEFRTVAAGALIRAARHSGSYADALEFVRQRKNEQDPVRAELLTALGELPAAAWRSDQLEGLGQVLQDALNAADLSALTASAAEQIVVRLAPFHPVWAAQWIVLLVEQRGQIDLHDFEQRITIEQAKAFAAALWPVAKSWATKKREFQLRRVLAGFGRHLKILPEFLELAERLTRMDQYEAQSSLQLIATYDKPRFNRLVPQLLKADKIWATYPIVYEHLHRHRQDLLTPFLVPFDYSYKYKFFVKHPFVLPVKGGFERWTPGQQTIFAATLGKLTRDKEREQYETCLVMKQLAAIPNASIAVLTRLADASNQRLVIRDTALRLLGRLDEARGLRELLNALEDDRARVAIYALRRLLLGMPSARALSVLQAAPISRVTVAKEVVRLIGELRSDAGFAHLIALDAQPLHRDVRVALLRALWDDLERDRTWLVLQAAATDPDPAIADGVIRIPAERLSAASQRQLVALLAKLIAHPDPSVRLETLRRCAWLPVTDPERLLIAPLLNALDSSIAEQTSAAAGAFFATYAAADAEVVRQAVAGILENRRVLALTLEAFLSSSSQQRQRLEGSARAILVALEPDVLTLQWQVRVALMCLPWTESADFMLALASRQQLDAGVFHAALTALGEVSQQRSQTQAGLQLLEQTWRDHSHELLRRLALETLILTTFNADRQSATWSAAQLEQLERYRADASSIVAAAAQFTFPPLVN